MKAEEIPNGVWPVMLTPFNEAGSIDFQGLERLIDWYIGQDVQGLFSACLSSETLHMEDLEKLALVEHVVRYADGRVPVVAGVMGVTDRARRIDMVREVLGFGAKAAVLTLCDITPETASDAQWMEEMDLHLEALRGCPLGIYECPLPYHRVLTPALMEYAVRQPEFLFLKETSGNLHEIGRKLRTAGVSGLKVFSADALTIRDALEMGASGFSGLQANLWPALHVELVECWKDDPERAERLQRFFEEYNWVVGRSYPASAKAYLNEAHGLDLGTRSFLNGASVSEDDTEWIREVAEAVATFGNEIDISEQMAVAANA